ncbi:hypothetical protein EVAR_71340_1, partial [Eumeta japonica]
MRRMGKKLKFSLVTKKEGRRLKPVTGLRTPGQIG